MSLQNAWLGSIHGSQGSVPGSHSVSYVQAIIGYPKQSRTMLTVCEKGLGMDGVPTGRMGILYTHGNVVLPTITSVHELITTKCSMLSFLFNQASEVSPKEMALIATVNISLTPGIQAPHNKSAPASGSAG